MNASPTHLTVPAGAAEEVAARVVCGVDGSAAGLAAAREAARIVELDGSLLLVAVAVGDELPLISPAGTGFAVARSAVDDSIRARYADGLRRAAAEVEARFPRAATRLLEGNPLGSLLAAAAGERATMVAVGSHGVARAPGIVLGSVATRLLHKAPCSVLVAREPEQPLPDASRRVLVGVDGSPESALAVAVARRLGETLELAADGGLHGVDDEAVSAVSPRALQVDEAPVEALVSRARPGDLIVVGSRGLRGPQALGSVSERVAHQAQCSVLVVRPRQEPAA